MEVGSAHDVNNVCKSDICCGCVGGILKQFQNEEGEESKPRRNRKDQICSRRNPENKSQCCACNTAARDSIQGHHGPIVSFPCVVVAFFIAFAFLLIAFSQEFSQDLRVKATTASPQTIRDRQCTADRMPRQSSPQEELNSDQKTMTTDLQQRVLL